MPAAQALREIVAQSPIPVIADIHFDYKLALAAIDAGVNGLRLNPGNIGGREKVEAVVAAARIKIYLFVSVLMPVHCRRIYWKNMGIRQQKH